MLLHTQVPSDQKQTYFMAYNLSPLKLRFLLCVQNTIIFLTVGEEKGAGMFLLAGPENLIAEVGPR